MDLHDRRRHERYLAWLDILVRDEKGVSHTGVIVELSASGALLQLGEGFDPGTPLALSFQQNGAVVSMACRVVRTHHGPGELLGVQFEAQQAEGAWNAIARVLSHFTGTTRPGPELSGGLSRGGRQ